MYKILIVEDDAAILGVLQRTLERYGYEPIAVQNFQDVLAEFSSCSPHLVRWISDFLFYDGYHWCPRFEKSATHRFCFSHPPAIT